jgi:hypothetical protein
VNADATITATIANAMYFFHVKAFWAFGLRIGPSSDSLDVNSTLGVIPSSPKPNRAHPI